MECFYCSEEVKKPSEHVFPKGFGGENILMDCVCNKCNSDFSKLERELLQKSLLAFPRSIEGIKGYNNKHAFFKPDGLFAFDEGNRLVLEVGQRNKMENYYRPQISESNSIFFHIGDCPENINLFIKKLKKWHHNPKLILEFLKDKEKNIRHLDIDISDTKNISFKEVISPTSAKNQVIFLEYKKTDKNDGLYKNMSPRIFMNDDGYLFLRARSEKESINFIKRIVRYLNSKNNPNKLELDIKDNGLIYVEQMFNPNYAERAIVKICINCLIHYFPKAKKNRLFTDLKEYILYGKKSIKNLSEQKNYLIDNCDKTHNITFSQNKEALYIRFSMFNGQAVFSFHIPHLLLFKEGEYYRLLIDYKNKKNLLQTSTEMILSHQIE